MSCLRMKSAPKADHPTEGSCISAVAINSTNLLQWYIKDGMTELSGLTEPYQNDWLAVRRFLPLRDFFL